MLTKHHLLLVLLIFSLLVVGGLAWFSWFDNRPTLQRSAHSSALQMPTVAAAVRKLSPLPVRPLSAKTLALRASAADAAAKGRGLQWLDQPGVTELTGWEYGTRTREMAEVLGGDDLRNLGRLAAAGGVLPEGLDLSTLAASFTAASAGATYSPFDKQILLLSNSKPSESLLTHELTHALQDQHFDLLKMLVVRPYNYDRSEAAFAIVEGDAVGVQRRFETNAAWSRRSLDDITRDEDDRFGEYRDTIGKLFPSLLVETFIFRYRDGTRFVEGVRRRRGQEGVDKLFREPPPSSEQVLHLDKYFAGEALRPVTLDVEKFTAQGWRAATSTVFGEVGVRGMLTERLDRAEAGRAAAGWGGDAAYLFARDGGEDLFVWKTVWDTPQDAIEFFRSYNRFLERRGFTANAEAKGARAVWREVDGRTTIVRRTGDGVLVVRGREATVQTAEMLAE